MPVTTCHAMKRRNISVAIIMAIITHGAPKIKMASVLASILETDDIERKIASQAPTPLDESLQ